MLLALLGGAIQKRPPPEFPTAVYGHMPVCRLFSGFFRITPCVTGNPQGNPQFRARTPARASEPKQSPIPRGHEFPIQVEKKRAARQGLALFDTARSTRRAVGVRHAQSACARADRKPIPLAGASAGFDPPGPVGQQQAQGPTGHQDREPAFGDRMHSAINPTKANKPRGRRRLTKRHRDVRQQAPAAGGTAPAPKLKPLGNIAPRPWVLILGMAMRESDIKYLLFCLHFNIEIDRILGSALIDGALYREAYVIGITANIFNYLDSFVDPQTNPTRKQVRVAQYNAYSECAV